ncbi:MAG: fibronectin type III domain-containing protein [Treponema sp.]|jgi:hypothetical protein|nr:fibronectin type III domain-containing protein [Treponema sp.]
MKHIFYSVFFVFLAGAALTGCESAGLDAVVKTLNVVNRSSITIQDIKWSDELFTNDNLTTLVPGGTAASTVSAGKAQSGKGYLFFNSTSGVTFRTRDTVSFADSDTFTFTNNTIVVELLYTANAGTLLKILSIPAGVTLNAGSGRITVSWAAVEGASSYNVYYGTGTAPPGTPAQTNIIGTSITIAGLTDGRMYHVWVQSVNANFVSALSVTRSITTPIVYTADTAGAFNQAIAAINADIAGSYAINITGSFDAGAVWFAANANKSIGIEGDGANRSISNNGNSALFVIPDGTSLILGSNITLHGNGKTSPVVVIETGGTLTMNSGSTITGSKMRGVYIDGGTFTMAGGTISGNSISAVPGSLINLCRGGGVFIDSGTFTMTSGTISENSAYAVISDPSISAYCYGGGVFVFGGSFTMTGGTISGNSASLSGISAHNGDGGGVYVDSGTFTMTGGTIGVNSASTFGGGVFIDGGTFIMAGGAINGNTAVNSGGGVYAGNGAFIMTGGTISGNTAVKFVGGGVAAEEDNGSFSKTGGIIDASNSATEGKVAYVSFYKKRDATAGPAVNLSSASAVNWE